MKIQNRYIFFCAIALLFLLPKSVGAASAEQTKKATLTVRSSLQCNMCVETIKKGLLREAGIEKVFVDLKKKEIRVEYDIEQTNSEKIKLAITRLGYDADDFPAVPKAYQALPFCCKKP